MDPILEMKHISKTFHGVHALDDVEFSCAQGEVHALVGENGAGKSTLLRILSGQIQADTGEIRLNGAPVNFKSPKDAQNQGIAIVNQELKLLPELTVAENVFLNREPRNFARVINKRKMLEDTRKMAAEYEIEIDPTDLVGNLPIAKQQMVEILKSLSMNPDIFILDEPTSSLAKNEVEKLFKIIKKLAEDKKSIVFISHRMEELFEICDSATVLKDGKLVQSMRLDTIHQDELVNLMVGRPLVSLFPPKAESISDEKILEVKNIGLKGVLSDISFDVHRGQVVGVAGLQGHGQTELLNCIAGILTKDNGHIYINSKEVTVKNAIQGIKAGIALIPEDRKTEGLFLSLSVRENLTAASLRQRSRTGLVQNKKESEFINKYIKELSIKTANPETAVGNLSGGNQQKVVLGKELGINPCVLLFNEPTRGIDVGTKSEFYKLIRDLASEGIAVVMYSSDLIELCGMSDKVIVMYEGKISGCFNKDEMSESNLMQAAVGMNSAGGQV